MIEKEIKDLKHILMIVHIVFAILAVFNLAMMSTNNVLIISYFLVLMIIYGLEYRGGKNG